MQPLDIFANLSMGKKLLLGFALVLLLTLGVAGTGFYTVDSILDRSYQVNQLSRVNAAILEARREGTDGPTGQALRRRVRLALWM